MPSAVPLKFAIVEGMSGESADASCAPLVSCATVPEDADGKGGVARAGKTSPGVLLGGIDRSGADVL
jgi:hypothetical protein